MQKRYDLRRLRASKVLNPPDFQYTDPFKHLWYDLTQPIGFLPMPEPPDFLAYLRMSIYDNLPRWERDFLKEGRRRRRSF